MRNPDASTVTADDLLEAQPPEHVVEDAARRISARASEDGTLIVALDDDPTGTQSVHGVPVVTGWGEEDLAWLLDQPAGVGFVLTNTRAVDAKTAGEVNATVADRVLRLSARRGREVELISRSDSTLRGHFPRETDVLAATLDAHGVAPDALLLCPCFPEAGRITVDDIHWVAQGDRFVPVAESEFARDATFGFTQSDLRAWVEEQTRGRVRAETVRTVGLGDIRRGGVDRVTELLGAATGGEPVVVNAVSRADLDVVALAVLRARQSGRRFLWRTGPTCVAARAGVEPREPLTSPDLYPGGRGPGHGLVVVGSHAALSTQQLQRLLALEGVAPIELDIPRLLDEPADTLAGVAEALDANLERADVVLFTSRARVTEDGRDASLRLSRRVSRALVSVIGHLVDRGAQLAFLVAKGGITASDIATEGLGVRRAEVAGQMIPGGVPVWLLTADSPFPGMPYVIFPGNVGAPETLAHVVAVLRGDR